MRWYYVHGESGCAFPSEDPPEVVMNDPCVEEVPREIYLRACVEFDIEPEPPLLWETLFGDLL